MKKIYFSLLLIICGVIGQAQIFSNPITDTDPSIFNPYTNGQTVDFNLAVSGIMRESGLTASSALNRYNATGWNVPSADDTKVFSFTFSALTGYVINFTNFQYTGQSSANGPTAFAFSSSADGFVTNIGAPTATGSNINLSAAAYQGVTSITFFFYGWNASTGAGSYSINDFAFNGSVVAPSSITTGTVSPASFNLASCSSTQAGTVQFNSSGLFQAGNNYIAQLSDATGSFVSPINIGSLASTSNFGTINITIPANTNGGPAYRIRVISTNPSTTGWPSSAFVINAPYCTTSATDYFRSNSATGNWTSASSWQSSQTGGAPWINATMSPTVNAGNVEILLGQTITINSPLTIRSTHVYGNLQVLTGGINNGIVTLANDPVYELTVYNGGILNVVSTSPDYPSTFIYNVNSNINILSGGKISIGDGAATHTGSSFFTFGTEPISRVYWQDGSILDWNSTGVNSPSFSVNYFPGALSTEVPVLSLSKPPGGTLGGAAAGTVNGLLEVNANNSLSGNGLKTFRNGIAGSATLTLGTSSGGYTISGTDGGGNPSAAIIGGTVTIVLNENLRLTNGVTIPAGANVVITNPLGTKQVLKTAGSLLVQGIIDLTTTPVSNTVGDVTVNGTIKTDSPNGIFGTGANIVSGTLILNPSTSTVEYKAPGAQAVQGGTVNPYYNLVLSGGGTKTLVSANTMTGTGTLTIAGAAIFDAGNNSIGNPATNLVMTGSSQFKTGGSGSKPDAGGTYTLGAGTTIEFYLGSATTVRLGSPAINYANMVINGINISNTSAGTGIKFQAASTFTVKTGATFRLASTAGFSGATNTAISNTNNPAIVLENNSTIEYNGAAQTITNPVSYMNLLLSGTGTKTASSGVLTVLGNFIKSGANTFAHNGGTVLFAGSTAQAVTSNTSISFNNFTNNNTTGLSINNAIRLASLFTAGTASVTNLNDSIVLLSDITNTARVGQLPGSAILNYGVGRFTVERFIPSHSKAWQFLSAPVAPAQTINAAWQEGNIPMANARPGFGTLITGTGTGFDISTNLPSLKTYDPNSNLWVGVSGTSQLISNSKGYMLFVRGDRSVTTSLAAPTAVTLRTTGKIYGTASDPAPVTTVLPGKFESVGNPLASPVDLTLINRSPDIQDIFYIWDPNLTTSPSAYGYGGYRTLTRNGGTYDVTPVGGNYGATTKFIQSGQAFFVKSVSTGGTVTFNESAKAGNYNLVNRPGVPTFTDQRLYASLYVVTGSGTVQLDGVQTQFSRFFSDRVDALDAVKFYNGTESIALSRENKSLVVDKRSVLQPGDTLFYELGQLKNQGYRLQFAPVNLQVYGMTGYLVDRYLNQQTEISLSDTTGVDFAVTSAAGSASSNRFYLVFTRRSTIETEKAAPAISIVPNPVINRQVNLVMDHVPPASYQVMVYNAAGQSVYQSSISYNGGNKTVTLPANIPAGVYHLFLNGTEFTSKHRIIIP